MTDECCEIIENAMLDLGSLIEQVTGLRSMLQDALGDEPRYGLSLTSEQASDIVSDILSMLATADLTCEILDYIDRGELQGRKP